MSSSASRSPGVSVFYSFLLLALGVLCSSSLPYCGTSFRVYPYPPHFSTESHPAALFKKILQFSHGGIGSWTYDYDKVGAMTYKLDPDGREVTAGYDFPGGGQSRSWMQDWTGRYEEISNPVTRTFTTAMPGNTVHKIMNKAGEVTRMTQEGRGDFVYTYDPVTSNLTSLLNPEGETTLFDYYSGAQGGMLWQQTFANGTYVTYPEYTMHGETQYYELYNNLNEVILSARMQYDNNGNRTHLEPNYNMWASLTLHQVEYDMIDQVVHEEFRFSDEPMRNYINSYRYDLNGNRQVLETDSASGVHRQSNYTYNGDQLLSVREDTEPWPHHLTTYDYDLAGRAISITYDYIPSTHPTFTELTYDCNGRITRIVNRDEIVSFNYFREDTYNAFDQWLTRNWNNNYFTTWAYEGFGTTATSLSKRVESSTFYINYIYTPSVSESKTDHYGRTTTLYYGRHEQNYPFATVESEFSSNLLSFIFNDAFGYFGSVSDPQSPFGFHGCVGVQSINDMVLSQFPVYLDKMGARYYDRITGRFLQPDPSYGLGGEDNLYAALNNNPISFVDPMGTDAEKINLKTSPKESLVPKPYTGMTRESERSFIQRNYIPPQVKTKKPLELISEKEWRMGGPERAAYLYKARELGGVKPGDPLYRYAIEDGETFNGFVSVLTGYAAVRHVAYPLARDGIKWGYWKMYQKTAEMIGQRGSELTSNASRFKGALNGRYGELEQLIAETIQQTKPHLARNILKGKEIGMHIVNKAIEMRWHALENLDKLFKGWR